MKEGLDGNVLRLTPEQDLTNEQVKAERNDLRQALDKTVEEVIMDLSQVNYIDSLGLGLIVGAYKSCKFKGISFRLEGVNTSIYRILKMVNFTQLFPVKTIDPLTPLDS